MRYVKWQGKQDSGQAKLEFQGGASGLPVGYPDQYGLKRKIGLLDEIS